MAGGASKLQLWQRTNHGEPWSQTLILDKQALLLRENEGRKREEAVEEKPSWCRWWTLVASWGASQHRQAQLMSLKQGS
jgi:hypothetical protein